jgi:hypothetical protein
MTDSDGNLSIDFLVGFTIFMVAFIWVATLVPNLFLGVSSHAIDFDAVAYRTGVILTEDSGATSATTAWENQPDSAKDNIERFGLAISKQTPNILSEIKVKRFFDSDDTGVFSQDDYRQKAIFGDYPYRFNISLLEEGQSPRFVGDTDIPENYGFMRKAVKIKHFSNATIDKTDVVKFKLNNSDTSAFIRDGNVTYHDFVIAINRSRLLYDNLTDPVINPNYNDAYRIDPRSDEINITVEGFHESPPIGTWVAANGFPTTVNLSCVTLSQTTNDEEDDAPVPLPPELFNNYLYHNMNLGAPVNPPFELAQNDNVSIIFKPGFFAGPYDRGSIFVTMRFEVATTNPDGTGGPTKGLQYWNTSKTGPWEYTYNTTEVSPPRLTNAVMEVAIW